MFESLLKLKKKPDSEPSASGLIVSEPKGDGRGNKLHKAAGTPEGGQFASKTDAGTAVAPEATPTETEKPVEKQDFSNISKYFKRLSKVYEAPTMNNFIANRQKMVNRDKWVTPEQKLNAERMRPHMRKLLDNSNFTICIKFTHFLSFLKDGKYKNQFETGTSHGLLSNRVRFNASRTLFGHGLSDIELGKDLEKYGCIQSKNIKSYFDEKSGSAYGGYSASGYAGGDGLHCCMILKKANMEDRTTYCMGDSLNTGVFPQKVTQPFDIYTLQVKSYFNNIAKAEKLFTENANRPCKLGGVLGSGNFIEAQYHGDVTYQDVSRLVIGNRSNFNNLDLSKKMELLNGCKERGIKVFVNNGHDDGLEQVNLDEQGNIYYTTYESEDINDD